MTHTHTHSIHMTWFWVIFVFCAKLELYTINNIFVQQMIASHTKHRIYNQLSCTCVACVLRSDHWSFMWYIRWSNISYFSHTPHMCWLWHTQDYINHSICAISRWKWMMRPTGGSLLEAYAPNYYTYPRNCVITKANTNSTISALLKHEFGKLMMMMPSRVHAFCRIVELKSSAQQAF